MDAVTLLTVLTSVATISAASGWVAYFDAVKDARRRERWLLRAVEVAVSEDADRHLEWRGAAVLLREIGRGRL